MQIHLENRMNESMDVSKYLSIYPGHCQIINTGRSLSPAHWRCYATIRSTVSLPLTAPSQPRSFRICLNQEYKYFMDFRCNCNEGKINWVLCVDKTYSNLLEALPLARAIACANTPRILPPLHLSIIRSWNSPGFSSQHSDPGRSAFCRGLQTKVGNPRAKISPFSFSRLLIIKRRSVSVINSDAPSISSALLPKARLFPSGVN